ncbi:MAG: complex I subunit 4 family protein [Polyangiaceae bacterium]|jgi:NADH-quinone oxidoreductase subunit M
MHPVARRRFIAALSALVVWLVATTIFAQASASGHGRLLLSLPDGSRGPLVLVPGQGGWIGQATITNVGSEPLTVSRVAVRGDEDDVRSPARLSVRFVDGAATSATLAPGTAKDVVVSWMPDRDPRVRQAFGHVVVTSTDEGAGEVAMGFRAQLPTGLGWVGEHALTLLVLWPLVLLPLAGAFHLAGRREGSLVGCLSIGVTVSELLFALSAYHRFAQGVGRADGNDGFQLVERSVWVRSLGSEWYLGVDGTSIPLVVLAATLGAVAAVIAASNRRDAAHYAALGLLASAIMGALVALDLVVFFVSWELVLVALVVLIGGWGGPRGQNAAAKLGVFGTIGSAAMLLAFVALSRASGRTFLVDGSPLAHTMSIPELARTSFVLRGPLLGVPFVEMVWGLLFVAVAAIAPIVPLHGWLPDALEEGPAGTTIVLGGVVVALGPYLLVRVGFGAVPEGARWMGASIAALGVLTAGWGALCAMAQRDLRRFFAYATLTSTGTCLYGIGALTPEGITGAIAGSFAHGLAAVLILGFAAALDQRVHTCHAGRFGGLAGETPRLATIAVVGLAVSVGAPGLVGSWGALLSLLGGFVWHPALAVLLAMVLVVSVAAHARIARLVLLGSVDPAWRSSADLEPYGGRFPDATPSEIAALVPVAVLALLLGVWPAPLLSTIGVGARDAGEAVNPSGPE